MEAGSTAQPTPGRCGAFAGVRLQRRFAWANPRLTSIAPRCHTHRRRGVTLRVQVEAMREIVGIRNRFVGGADDSVPGVGIPFLQDRAAGLGEMHEG